MFYWVLLGFTGFYYVLPSFYGSNWALGLLFSASQSLRVVLLLYPFCFFSFSFFLPFYGPQTSRSEEEDEGEKK